MLLVILMTKNNFLCKLLLTKTQVLRLPKGFANTSSANKKLSKTQLHKIGKSGRLFGRISRPLLKTGQPLIGNILKPLAKSVLIPLELTTVTSATDAATYKKMFGSGNATLIISDKEMNDIMKIVKSIEESGLLIKGVSETIKNEAKERRRGFLEMLLGTLGAR